MGEEEAREKERSEDAKPPESPAGDAAQAAGGTKAAPSPEKASSPAQEGGQPPPSPEGVSGDERQSEDPPPGDAPTEKAGEEEGEGKPAGGETGSGEAAAAPSGGSPITCPHCGKEYGGPAPPPGELLFCPSCDAVIPTASTKEESPAKGEGGPQSPEEEAKAEKVKGKEAVGQAKAKKSESTTLVCKNCNTKLVVYGFKAGDIRFCEKCNSSLSVQKKPETKVIGGYVLEGEVARGGMAVVYRARQKSLNRLVAIKVLLAAEGAPQHLVKQLHREAQAAAKLRHPNIVNVIDVGVFKGLHYIAMDLVEGKPLDRLVGKRRFKGKVTAEIVKKIAEAIHYAHEQGVIHRDIKPSNILLEKGDEPRVMDFGLAKDRTTGTDPLSGAGISGTPEYMSPEQAQGSDDLDRKSDVFSLGAVLYALLAGSPPFKGKTVKETLQAAIRAEPKPPSALDPQLPPELEAICLKAMAKEKDDRYPSAKAMAEDLDRYLKDDPVSAASQTFASVILKKARRNPVVWIGAVAGVLFLALVIFIVAVVGGGSEDSKTDKEKEEEAAAARRREEEKRQEEDKQAWKQAYEESRREILDKIARIKSEVEARINHAYSEMTKDPDRALATLMDARALLLEMGDKVMVDSPEEFRHMLVKDKKILEEALAKKDGQALDNAKASALGARAWNRWERELDLDGAALDYEEALRASKGVPAVLAGRGMMYREAALWARAYKDFSAVIKTMDDFADTTDNLKYLLDSAIRSGKGGEVKDLIDRLPEDTGDREYYRGLSYLFAGDADNAITAFQGAVKHIAFHGPAKVGCCWAMHIKGKNAEALKTLEDVILGIRERLMSRQKKKTVREEMLAQIDLVDALVLRGDLRTTLARGAKSDEERMALQRDARSDFQEALRIHPADNRARSGLANLGG